MAKEEIVLRVAAKSDPSSTAGSIAKNIQEGKEVSILAVGAGAVNQAVKAYNIARGFVAPSGKDLFWKSGFIDVYIPNEAGVEEKKTGIKIQIIVM